MGDINMRDKAASRINLKAYREYRTRLKELLLHAIWTTENEGLLDDGDCEMLTDFVAEEFHITGTEQKALKETADANIQRDRISEDRHRELFRARQAYLARKDCMGRQPPKEPRYSGCRCRLAYPVSESCPCPACRAAREED
jgi:hypothetical protein